MLAYVDRAANAKEIILSFVKFNCIDRYPGVPKSNTRANYRFTDFW